MTDIPLNRPAPGRPWLRMESAAGAAGGGGVVGPLPIFVNAASQARINGAGPVSVGNPAGGFSDCLILAAAAANVAIEVPIGWGTLASGSIAGMFYTFAWTISAAIRFDNDWNPSTASGLTMSVLEAAWHPVTGIARLGGVGAAATTTTPSAPGLTTPGAPELAILAAVGQPGGFFDEITPPPTFTMRDFIYPGGAYAATFSDRALSRQITLPSQVSTTNDPGPAATVLLLLNNGFGYA